MHVSVRTTLILAIAVAGCAKAPERADERARLVVTEPAVVDDAVDRIAILGDVHGEQEVRVFAQVPERIRVLHVREGDAIHAGDPIVTLDADLQSSGLMQADAALTAAEVAREQAQADLERTRQLVDRGVLAQAQLEAASARVRSGEAQVRQLDAARRSAGAQRARTVVRAPIDGTVALLSVSQGDMTAPSMPICTLVQTARVLVELQVTEQDYVRIREGMPVEVRAPALPDVVRQGTVSRVSPVLDRMTRTAEVEVLVDNADGVLRPGMVADVGIELSRRPGAVMAPSRALVLGPRTDTEREASVFVFDREAGVAHRRTVRLGQRFERRVEILEGLEGDEDLVVEGQHLLRDGASVRTREDDEAQAAGTP